MSFSFFTHSLFLALAVGLTYLWVKNPVLSFYSLQLTAALILVYFFNFFLWRGKQKINRQTLVFDTLIFTAVILLLVETTGGLQSPLFFLLYFLLFATSLLLTPELAFVLILVLFLFYFDQIWQNPTLNFLKFGSLALISPLSYILGRQYLRLAQEEKRVEILEAEIKTLENDIQNWTRGEVKENLEAIAQNVGTLLHLAPRLLTTTQIKSLNKILEILQKLKQEIAELPQEIENIEEEFSE